MFVWNPAIMNCLYIINNGNLTKAINAYILTVLFSMLFEQKLFQKHVILIAKIFGGGLEMDNEFLFNALT